MTAEAGWKYALLIGLVGVVIVWARRLPWILYRMWVAWYRERAEKTETKADDAAADDLERAADQWIDGEDDGEK